jgi:hypothetical protein
MDAFDPALRSVHMQPPMPQIDLSPAKLAQLSSTKSMPIRQEDRRAVPGGIAPTLARSIEQLLYPLLGEILTLPICCVR